MQDTERGFDFFGILSKVSNLGIRGNNMVENCLTLSVRSKSRKT